MDIEVRQRVGESESRLAASVGDPSAAPMSQNGTAHWHVRHRRYRLAPML